MAPTYPALIGALLVWVTARSAHAQVEAYLALGTRLGISSSQGGTATLPDGGERAIVLRQPLRVPGVGAARLGYALRPRTTLELGYTIALVNVSIGNEGVPLFPGTAGGTVHTFALRPRIRLARIGVATIGHGFAGPALVWRTGNGFDAYQGTLRVAANIGLGVTFDAGKLRFRADLEDVIYSSALRRSGVLAIERTTRHDFLVTIGIAVLRL